MKINLEARRAFLTSSAIFRSSQSHSGSHGFDAKIPNTTTTTTNDNNGRTFSQDIVQMFRDPSLKTKPGEPNSMARFHRRSPSIRETDERFFKILRIFKWGPDAEKATEVLLLNIDHRLVREVLNLDVEIGVKLQFFKWAAKKKNLVHDCCTYMPLIRRLAEAGLVGEMWQTILQMVKSDCRINPSVLSELVRILGKVKMVEKACVLFYRIKASRCKPSVYAYNCLFSVLIRANCHDKVQELYKEMCSEGKCLPDTVTYTMLIANFGKLGHVDSAINLFKEMRENGLQPSAKIYTSLMGTLFKSSRYGEALKLFQEMRDKRFPPNVFTYTEVINGLGKAGRVQEALRMFQDMQKDGCSPDVILFNKLIDILGNAGQLDSVFKLFGEMESLGCTPTVVTYNSVMEALFKAKNASGALKWFEGMKEKGIHPSPFTYSILIAGLCKTNRLEKALMLLEEMDEKGFPPCPAAYCSLIDALGKAHRYDAAVELFKELIENGNISSSRIYAVMIKHLGKANRIDAAIELFGEMQQRGCIPDVYSYNALMSGLVRANFESILLHLCVRQCLVSPMERCCYFCEQLLLLLGQRCIEDC
ncbi:pentatricopeptide repeat-containing protein At3g16010 isoform X5 [Cryptomeria japonica]|uniref:pentatricopeptide repeat-containing protein At3g16010 isoform X5 n=1 Tax=Cryptomeria japonica TaxID=3369 RepID=UPI0027D9D9E2|nr:pentatricopeptide repeat-containing protein At3g16010 isoform X5 [Cryptomeria japonica]